MIYREPRNLIIQVEDSLLGQVLYYWNYYNKPCSLLVLSAKTDGLSAIKLVMNNPDAGSLVYVCVERLKVRLYDGDTRQPVHLQDLFL